MCFSSPVDVTLRRSDERGWTRLDWLDSRHAFSFGDYREPGWRGFHGLRVLNDDVVAPGRGFGPHPHRDAEILSFVLDGALFHEDSTGGRSRVRAGEIQAMSAGPGVAHAEWNASTTEPVRFVQVWLAPDRRVEAPSFAHGAPGWRHESGPVLVASRDGREGSLRIHADASIFAARLAAGDGFLQPIAHGRAAWLQVLSGRVGAAGEHLGPGDAVGVERTEALAVRAHQDAELLLFDLAATHRR